MCLFGVQLIKQLSSESYQRTRYNSLCFDIHLEFQAETKEDNMKLYIVREEKLHFA